MAESEILVCPFCSEEGFDAIGLKSHLLGWCEPFENIESIAEELQRKRAEKLASEKTAEETSETIKRLKRAFRQQFGGSIDR